MLDLGFLEDVEKILSLHARRPPDGAVQRDDAAGDPRAGRAPPLRPGDGQGQGRDADDRHRRAVLRSRPSRREKTDALVARARGRAARARRSSSCARRSAATSSTARCATRGMNVKALHGDMSQGARDGVMISFKSGRVPILVATDVAARGLDIVSRHARRQLRRADLARRLRAPHRAHRPRRALGPRDHVRRAAPEARARGDREPRQHDDLAVGRGRARRAGRRVGAAAPPSQAARRGPRPQRRRATRKLIASGGRAGGPAEADLIAAVAAGAGLDGEAIRNVRAARALRAARGARRRTPSAWPAAVDGTEVRRPHAGLEPIRT